MVLSKMTAITIIALTATTAVALDCDETLCTSDADQWYENCLREASQSNQSGLTESSCKENYQRRLKYCKTCQLKFDD